MSTSDLLGAGPASEDVARAIESAATSLAALPDAAVLTRLANDLFAAVPGSGDVSTAIPGPAIPVGVGAPSTSFDAHSLDPLRIQTPPQPATFTEHVAPAFAPYFLQFARAGAGADSAPLAGRAFPQNVGASLPGTAIGPVPGRSTFPLPREADLRRLLAPIVTPSVPHKPLRQGGDNGLYWAQPRTTSAPAIPAAPSHPPFAADLVRRDFPILSEQVNGKPLVWLDNGATTQKPRVVIDRLTHFYEHENSNIHRAAHELAARSTDAYEGARESVRRFLNAPSVEEIVFVRGATEAINLVAKSWGRRFIVEGDEIVVSWLEHHANIVPWQQLIEQTGARLRVIPVDDRGQILLDAYQSLLGPRTKLVAFTHVSNALGTITPVAEMVQVARRYGAHVLVDGAQSVPHLRVDVQSLDCDFYVFSGHKVFAPTGIGALYGKSSVLSEMPPWQGGGNMIKDVRFEHTEYQPPPGRFEAGTGSIADAVGLGAALDYLMGLGIENVTRHEHDLLVYATERLHTIPGLKIYGSASEKAAVLSFTLEGWRSEDIGVALNREGIAVRAGHHCAQPILRRFGVESTVRASFALYNTLGDVDALVEALRHLRAA
ncbi:MAG: family 2A encapsulin nanocompartment cargo protein cysteine desulfurase [Geminicoccaceae bacterium]